MERKWVIGKIIKQLDQAEPIIKQLDQVEPKAWTTFLLLS